VRLRDSADLSGPERYHNTIPSLASLRPKG
jgi:hypothetical protein